MAELSTLGSVIKTAYEAEEESNAFTDAEKASVGNATQLLAVALKPGDDVQAAVDANTHSTLTFGAYDLGGGTLTLPKGHTMHFGGGVLSNGTIACDGAFFTGLAGLSETITLTGYITSDVCFDWFICEKATVADYNSFINGGNSVFGPVPAISATNRTIMSMLLAGNYEIYFGSGIYPFDGEFLNFGKISISSASRLSTLLWFPQSHFLHYTVAGPIYPMIKDIRIECYGSVILTDAGTANAIHGLVCKDAFFASYTDHAFHNDYTITGGTGCPIYGSKFTNCAVYAGADKGGIYGWQSGSNVFDNFVDLISYFNGISPLEKGLMKAIFYNSNVMKYTNSNVTYVGFDYVFYWTRPNFLVRFNAYNNVFETNASGFKAICRVDGSGCNFYLDVDQNQYIGTPTDGYYYICNAGNTYISSLDAAAEPVLGSTIRNTSKTQFLKVVTNMVDEGSTKYRLSLYEPEGTVAGNSYDTLLSATQANAKLIDMESEYLADSANISYIVIRPSKYLADIGGFSTRVGAYISGTL